MAKLKPARVAFPKKNQRPSEAEFAARLPEASGKRLEATRAFLKKQRAIVEDLFFYGPRTGWAFRYQRGKTSVCAVMIHDGRPLGIVSLDGPQQEAVDWKALSPVGQAARKAAHGSPSLLWLDVKLDGSGAADFKALLRAKLKLLPVPAVATAAAPAPVPAARPAVRPAAPPAHRPN